MEYKDTLNLPATDFPMKANLNQREPEMLAKWEAAGPVRADGSRPEPASRSTSCMTALPTPTATSISVMPSTRSSRTSCSRASACRVSMPPMCRAGTATACRSNCRWRRTWARRSSQVTKLEMRKLCREYAAKFVAIQKEEFKRLGILGDWENPYLTMNYEYEGLTAGELAKFAHNGGLYRGRKPVHWCSSCVTALAEAEVEYADHTSPSIFVRFALQDDVSAAIPALAGKAGLCGHLDHHPLDDPGQPGGGPAPRVRLRGAGDGAGRADRGRGAARTASCTATGLTGEVIATFTATLLERKTLQAPLLRPRLDHPAGRACHPGGRYRLRPYGARPWPGRLRTGPERGAGDLQPGRQPRQVSLHGRSSSAGSRSLPPTRA